MKHTKYILASFICLTILASCCADEASQTQVDTKPTSTDIEVTENLESNQIENLENTQIEDTKVVEVDQNWTVSILENPSVSYSTYEWDLSVGTDEKILFFYSAESGESVEIDGNLLAETNLAIFSDILKVDMETHRDFVEKYDITEANTFILIDEDGNLITQMNGATSSVDLLKLYD